MTKIVVYGIPNCDTTKKAINFLKDNKIDFYLHDYKQEGIEKEKLTEWTNEKGLDLILNKRSTTWKQLTPEEQKLAETKNGAIELMHKYNTLIKRPIILNENKLLIGFTKESFKP